MIKQKNLRHMVARVHKNTNVLVILKVCDAIFLYAEHNRLFGPQDCPISEAKGPLEIPRKIADYVFCPHKKYSPMQLLL